jgi:hypothetical protein
MGVSSADGLSVTDGFGVRVVSAEVKGVQAESVKTMTKKTVVNF